MDEGTARDRELVRTCQGGSRAAFDELVRRHYALAYNIAFRMLGDHSTSSDAVQVAFVRAYKAIGRFRHDATFSTWLYRIVTNVCLDQIRTRDRGAQSLTVPDEDEPSLEERDIPDTAGDPAQAAEQRERQEAVQRALLRLNASHREILVMYDLAGLAYEQISEALQVPLGTVKSRLNRARQALMRELADEVELFD